MLVRIAEIVHYMQKRQYQRANDSYLRLSIGNAPWPIGVTMVGYATFLLLSFDFIFNFVYQYPRAIRAGKDLRRSGGACT